MEVTLTQNTVPLQAGECEKALEVKNTQNLNGYENRVSNHQQQKQQEGRKREHIEGR